MKPLTIIFHNCAKKSEIFFIGTHVKYQHFIAKPDDLTFAPSCGEYKRELSVGFQHPIL